MNKKICPICSSALKESFTATVIQKYEAVFAYCSACGFLCAEDPFFTEESYSSAIALTDTGLVARNIELSERIAVLLYFLMGERGKGRYADVAGGYGLLTRLMRDYGFDYYWADKYCKNIFARGFEYTQETGICRAVTAIEVMEHTENPLEFIQEAFAFARTDTLIFTTELFEGDPPSPDEWWYYSFETGQHISFFQKRTLQYIANKLNLNLFSHKSLHIFTERRINPIAYRLLASVTISHYLSWIPKRFMPSRIVSDQSEIKERNFGSDINR